MPITAKEQKLNEIFGDDYVFSIPVYQRPYAWDKKQVDELLDDLADGMDLDPNGQYFLGSVVLIKSEGQPESEVVDGQQRLTTLTMLLCVLRDLSTDPQTAGELDRRIWEVGDSLSGSEDRFRLSLRERDRKFFQEHVQKTKHLDEFLKLDPVSFSDSQKRIFENVKCIRQELLKWDEQRRFELARYLMQNCCVAVVAASDTDSAYRIFSVMNDRGLSLSATDIIKARVIGKMREAVRDEYTEKWESIEEELGRENFRDLFAHIRMICLKDKLRGTLPREFLYHILGSMMATEVDEEADREARKFVDKELEPYADVYETISRASYESTVGAENVNRHLRYLGRLDNFDWIPPAMAYFRRNEGQQDALIRFTRDLERLAYGLFVMRANINERIRRYRDVLSIIETGGDLFLESSPLQLRQGEKVEILKILDGNIYELPRVPMPLLLRLDSLLTDAGAGHDQPVISIEHVLPQSPNSTWLESFPDESERHQWTHRLANLVLLSRRKNTRASNYDFDRKKREYFQKNGTTTFALTTQVVSESEWTPCVLKRRQKALLEALKKEWRLD